MDQLDAGVILALVAIAGSGGFNFVKIQRGMDGAVSLKMLGVSALQTLFLCACAWSTGWKPSPSALIPWGGVCAVLWFIQMVTWEMLSESFIAGYVRKQTAESQETTARAQKTSKLYDVALTLANGRLQAKGENTISIMSESYIPSNQLTVDERKLLETLIK